MTPGRPQSALLFMPDISGFTQFVNETEISHSQHIVQELLEILIDSNHLNLEISEVEGDAIFFYKLGNKPNLQSLLQQVEKMFTRFHSHLKLYEHQRVCTCGACKNATGLSLKIIAHFGEVTGISVKDHNKLFGKDVILIHRLLKNNLDKKEYVILTDPLIEELRVKDLPSWYIPCKASEQYDLGEIQFSYSDLSSLHNAIRVTPPVYNSSAKTYSAFSKEEIIEAPMEKIFATLIDLQQAELNGHHRSGNSANDTIIKVGTKHPCLITRNNSINVTESVKIEQENIEMVEMSVKGIAGYRYTFKKISSNQTRLSIEMLIKNSPLFRMVFPIGIKPKMMKRIGNFFINLKKHLKEEESPAL